MQASTVIDVYPGDGDWTRLFSDIVGPEGRRVLQLRAGRSRALQERSGRPHADAMRRSRAGRELSKPSRRTFVAMPEATQPADVLWLHLFYHDLHTALIQARGATAAHFNRAVYERLKPGGSYVIVDHAAAVGTGTSDAQSLPIGLSLHSPAKRWRRRGSYWTRKAPCSRRRTIPHSIKVFDPSDQGRDRSLRPIGLVKLLTVSQHRLQVDS